jgi:hypothetical protein
MAKRYHGKGKSHALDQMNQDMRKVQGKSGGGPFTLPSDMSAVAQMPKNVIYEHCSEPYSSLPSTYRDDIKGIDAQIGGDISQLRKGFGPKKV